MGDKVMAPDMILVSKLLVSTIILASVVFLGSLLVFLWQNSDLPAASTPVQLMVLASFAISAAVVVNYLLAKRWP